MSVPMILLPVFVQVGLTFCLLVAMALSRGRAVKSGETKLRDIALREQNWPARATQIANCFANTPVAPEPTDTPTEVDLDSALTLFE